MESLADPLGDRVVTDLPAPPVLPLSEEHLYPNSQSKVPDWKVLQSHLAKEGKVEKQHFVKLIKDATDIYKNEPNLLQFSEPLVMVGDIHGQFYDLIHLIEKAGDPATTNYVLMGDYVDRGIYGVECIMLLIAIKLTYPETFAMLRGNHECRNMTDHFTFREEVIEKYDEEVYNLIMEMFDSLPICGLADKKYFITHGGISPELKKISKINKIDRFIEIPMEGILCDLMWADPIEEKDAKNFDFIENQERDCSYYFGRKPAKKLIDENNLMTIVQPFQIQFNS